MIILGKNSNDIGSQLERLTRKILKNKGYTDVTVNEVSSGGQEIDVTANFILPVPGKPQSKRLIAECKAYRNPISIPAWLKFLGKIYFEEARTSGEIIGLFVALSGVNGNVSGNFHELNQHRDNISILSGDHLLDEVTNIYNIPSRQKIIASFEQLSSRKYLNIEAAYYEEQIYWLFTFSNDEYSILTAAGKSINKNELSIIRPLIEKSSSLTKIIDLNKEAEAIARKVLLQKIVISSLITDDGASGLDKIIRKNTEYRLHEVQEAIDLLKNRGWVKEINGTFSLTSTNIRSPKCYELLREIINFFFRTKIPTNLFIEFFTAPFFEKRLNKLFLRHVSKIQGGLPFNDDLKNLTLKIIKLSPGALLYSINPDPMIVTHRIKDPQITSIDIDEFDRRVFKRSLLQKLNFDFEQQPLTGYFFETKGIREIENIRKVLVKSKNKLELQEEFNMRNAIGAAHESIGGGYVQILVLDHAPQPWEEPFNNPKIKT